MSPVTVTFLVVAFCMFAWRADAGGDAGGSAMNPCDDRPNYPAYRTTPLSPCSTSCEGGVQTRTWLGTGCVCFIGGTEQQVPLGICESFAPGNRPVLNRSCGQECFDYKYFEILSACNATCGSGKQKITYECERRTPSGVTTIVSLSVCEQAFGEDVAAKPKLKDCSEVCEYDFKEWSQCSVTCGSGIRTRERRCLRVPFRGPKVPVDFKECQKDTNLLVQPRFDNETCDLDECPCEQIQYVTTAWSPCSSTCEGVNTRGIGCQCRIEGQLRPQNLSLCDMKAPTLRPQTSRSCGVECPVYNYRYGLWGDCDSDCGPGVSVRLVQCIKTQESLSQAVSIRECVDNGAGQPEVSSRSCHSRCRYETTPFEKCSVTCGGGIRRRFVICVRTTERNGVTSTSEVDLAKCQDDSTIPDPTPPPKEEPCNTQECPCIDPRWQPSAWSDCSVTCGTGMQNRTVECRCDIEGIDTVVDDQRCGADPRPNTTRSCSKICPCLDPRWVTSPWEPCDRTCGRYATRIRSVTCRCRRGDIDQLEPIELCDNDDDLEERPEPIDRETCAKPCPCANDTIEYKYTEWRDCDKQCDGTQTRQFQCRCLREGVDKWVDDLICKNYLGEDPVTSKPCAPPCSAKWEIIFGWSLVGMLNLPQCYNGDTALCVVF